MQIAKSGNALAVRKKPEIDTMFERLRTLRGRLPADFKFSRDEANARDVKGFAGHPSINAFDIVFGPALSSAGEGTKIRPNRL